MQTNKERRGLFGNIGSLIKKKLEIAVAIGVIALAALMLLPGFDFLKQEVTEGTAADPATKATSYSGEEEKLRQTLSAIKGAGEVKVMITYAGDTTTQNESDARQVLSGAAEEKTAVTGSEVIGVIVVAQGADDIAVKIALTGAVQTALGIPSNKVDIYEMKE